MTPSQKRARNRAAWNAIHYMLMLFYGREQLEKDAWFSDSWIVKFGQEQYEREIKSGIDSSRWIREPFKTQEDA